MTTFKKTAIKAAVVAMLTVGANANAAPVVNFSFSGNFDMYDSSGNLWWSDATLSGTISMDMTTFGGTAQMQDSTPFSGYMWTAHNIELSMNPDFSVNSHMLFDWNGNNNISVYTQFQLTPSLVNNLFDPMNYLTWVVGDQFSVTTNDADNDGIPGNKIVGGPFPGFSPAFSGVATFIGADLLTTISNNNIPAVDPAAVPVPAAMWLFASGLLGLTGLARRKKAA